MLALLACSLVFSAPASADERCTNQIDYAGDPRSNAEINGIGASTGHCPAPINESTGTNGKFTSIQQFGDAYSGAVCNELAADPQRHTIWAMVSVWMTQTNLNYGQLQKGIGYAIANYCPQYNGIYQSYRSYYP
ncbi:hypothetical protein AB0876_33980 [Mycobacterium sp. NPDC049093]